ncbi:MAG: hypothetical protein IJB97_02865 [Clostridia bacterium]|nr:hypothetical protein [Clostridia bacterium]
MKKFLSVLCCLMILGGFSACADLNADEKESGAPSAPQQSTEQSSDGEESENGDENSGGESSESSGSFKPIINGGNYAPDDKYN